MKFLQRVMPKSIFEEQADAYQIINDIMHYRMTRVTARRDAMHYYSRLAVGRFFDGLFSFYFIS